MAKDISLLVQCDGNVRMIDRRKRSTCSGFMVSVAELNTS